MKIYNKKARHNYHILQTLEAGVVLSGAEVKSVRNNRVDISDSFARIQNGEVVLKNAYIYPYDKADDKTYDPRHDRKLLLHKKEIDMLLGKISGAAVTLVPISFYTTRNMIKVELGLVASKKKYDKRRAIKERDEQRKIDYELRADKFEYDRNRG